MVKLEVSLINPHISTLVQIVHKASTCVYCIGVTDSDYRMPEPPLLSFNTEIGLIGFFQAVLGVSSTKLFVQTSSRDF